MIKAINIYKSYLVQGVKKQVFSNLSLTIEPNERLAILGKNGSGKSTLLRLLCGIERPNKGNIEITSTISWPVGLSSGFILNLTGEENVKFVCRLFRCTREQIREKIDFILWFSELDRDFYMPIKTYSSGMRAKLSFGMSMAFDFDFYIVDEAMAVGDPTFQKKSKEVFFQRMHNKGMIMVSHQLNTLKEFCNKAILLTQEGHIQSNDINQGIALYKKSISK